MERHCPGRRGDEPRRPVVCRIRQRHLAFIHHRPEQKPDPGGSHRRHHFWNGGIPFKDAKKIIEKALEEGKIDTSLLDSIYEDHSCLPNENREVITLSGDEARVFAERFDKKEDIQEEN